MAAAGLRGTFVEPGPGSGGSLFDSLMLTGKTDAMVVGTATDAVSGREAGNLAVAAGRVTRLRLGLEASLPLGLGDSAVLTPGFELGLPRDGGDSETGFGTDIDASLVWADPKRGLRGNSGVMACWRMRRRASASAGSRALSPGNRSRASGVPDSA